MLFTWEEERAIDYYAPEYHATRLRRPEHFWRAVLAAPEPPERVLATGAVLEGFGPAGAEMRPFFRPVVTLATSPLLYPTYHEVTLYMAGPEIYDYARQR